MPELPDISLYLHHLERCIGGATVEAVRIWSPNLLRTAEPPVEDAVGRHVTSFRRIGKRIAIGLDGDRWLVLHLMIAGRLHWKDRNVAAARGTKGAAAGRAATTPPTPKTAKRPGRRDLAEFTFSTGTLRLTEASTRQRASLHYVVSEAALAALDPGGLEPLDLPLAAFREVLTRENHTLKRALTDPRLLSGIGNAYSDELLHRARLSPLRLTSKLDGEEWARLHAATQSTLRDWIARLREQAGEAFPEHVTAFRPEMAVHGKYREPCPVCAAPVQRIRYADNETNYCARCQTEGRLLADRSLSRLLKSDWPRTLEEMEGGE